METLDAFQFSSRGHSVHSPPLWFLFLRRDVTLRAELPHIWPTENTRWRGGRACFLLPISIHTHTHTPSVPPWRIMQSAALLGSDLRCCHMTAGSSVPVSVRRWTLDPIETSSWSVSCLASQSHLLLATIRGPHGCHLGRDKMAMAAEDTEEHHQEHFHHFGQIITEKWLKVFILDRQSSYLLKI